MFGKLFFSFLAVVVVLAIIGFLMKKRSAAKKGEEEVMSEKTVENVLDLNDQFIRARYVENDDEQGKG